MIYPSGLCAASACIFQVKYYIETDKSSKQQKKCTSEARGVSTLLPV